MTNHKITPEKINSPIQLMAAWFVMLIVLTGVLLATATQIKNPDWAAGYLVIFSSFVVLAVIGCVLLMLTIFRPHLQEGKEYAQWLKDKGQYSEGYITSEIMTGEDVKKNAPSDTNMLMPKQEIKISIINIEGAGELTTHFKRKFFSADIYKPIYESTDLKNKTSQEAIWLGSKIPPALALEIMTDALDYWPHLKYIHLSSDGNGPSYTHWQIFIGGSTNTAVNRYNLKEWTKEELNGIDPNINIEDFHRIIRKKYS